MSLKDDSSYIEKNDTIKQRNFGLDILRIISMVMILTLHYLDKGGLLGKENNSNFYYIFYYWLEAVSIIAVNVYVLISGYFLVETEFKWKKVLKLWGEVIFYSITIYLILIIFGHKEIQIKELVKSFFPILTKEYWFVNVYLMMYILSPFMNKLIYSLDKEQYRKLLVILIIGFSIYGILPSEYTFDSTGGYGIIWFVCLYLIAGYIRLHFNSSIKSIRYVGIYFSCTILITICMLLIDWLCNYLGRATLIGKILQYNNIIVLIESIAIFMFFKQLNIKGNKLMKIVKITAPCTFAVYLIHEQYALRTILYDKILYIEMCYYNPYSIFISIGSIMLMFLMCIIIELIRQRVFRKINNISKKV